MMSRGAGEIATIFDLFWDRQLIVVFPFGCELGNETDHCEGEGHLYQCDFANYKSEIEVTV